MNFNFNSWKQAISQNIKGWKARFKNEGINSLYFGLTATSLLPVVQAYHTGEVASALIALGGVSSGLGANLLANKIQGWKDKNEAQIAVDLQTAPELKELLDQLLEKMETLAEAQKDLPTDNEQLWFEKTLKEELTKIGSRVSFQTTLTEGGAIAQGDGAMAVGTGGIIVGGDMNNATIMQGENARKIDAGTYIEKQVIESPNPEKEKKAKAREKYLNRLSRVCLSLPLVALGGVDGDESDITLDKIYIALNITEQRQRDEEVLDKEAIQEYREKREFWTGEELNPALESVAKHKKLALLGDPGAGKSTFVKNLLAWQAGLMLGKIQVSNGIESELLPALIILRDLTPRLANVEIDSLPTSQRDAKLTQIVWEHMQADLGKECAYFHEGLSEALHSGKCLLVLDGLDEVPHDLRVRVRQAVDALFKQYHLQRAIITCRVRSYVGETILPSFESRTLAPFDEDQIRNFVEHWYTTQHTLGKFNEEQAKDRMNDLSNAALEDDMQELSSNPMLLTTMAIIHQREVGLPRERVRLYQQAVEVLLRR